MDVIKLLDIVRAIVVVFEVISASQLEQNKLISMSVMKPTLTTAIKS